mmetsp:Transcript_2778/g.7061  ORF Transcript_2778/g.7061 Transcript_2778/m.7061 type:complete len:89 (+) Transcript_2778:13-279(+)
MEGVWRSGTLQLQLLQIEDASAAAAECSSGTTSASSLSIELLELLGSSVQGVTKEALSAVWPYFSLASGHANLRPIQGTVPPAMCPAS